MTTRKPSHPEPDETEPDPAPAAEPAPPATTLPEPPPPTTIADEQRQRSDEIARQGVEKWKAERDERTAEEKAGRQVPGVASPAPVEGGSWQGSTRTTPPARAAQNPAAPR